MIVTVEEVNLVIPAPRQARSAGIHVSTIIRMIATETGVLKPEFVEELSLVEVTPSMRFSDPVVAIRVCIGLAWEDWYIPMILGPEGIVDHLGEYYLDGIYMSPDAEELSSIVVDRRVRHFIRVHEIKATSKSINTVGETAAELAGQVMWMMQLKSYCKGAGTRFADLHVLFLYGGYERPFMRPRKRRFRIEFTQQEIDDNWDLITSYRDARLVIEGLA